MEKLYFGESVTHVELRQDTPKYRRYIPTHLRKFIFDALKPDERLLVRLAESEPPRPNYNDDSNQLHRYIIGNGYLRMLRYYIEDVDRIGIGIPCDFAPPRSYHVETILERELLYYSHGSLDTFSYALSAGHPRVYRYLAERIIERELEDNPSRERISQALMGSRQYSFNTPMMRIITFPIGLDEVQYLDSLGVIMSVGHTCALMMVGQFAAAKWLVDNRQSGIPTLRTAVIGGHVEGAEWVYQRRLSAHLASSKTLFPCSMTCEVCLREFLLSTDRSTSYHIPSSDLYSIAISMNNLAMLEWLCKHVDPHCENDRRVSLAAQYYPIVTSETIQWLAENAMP